MTIGKKMYIYFGCCGMIPFIMMAVMAYNFASKSLRVQAENNLTAVREIKSNQINDYFTNKGRDLRTFSTNPNVALAMEELSYAYGETGGKTVRDLYIFNNPHPTGKKLDLIDAGDKSGYTAIHSEYHPMFKEFLEEYGYYDIFLVDEAGNTKRASDETEVMVNDAGAMVNDAKAMVKNVEEKVLSNVKTTSEGIGQIGDVLENIIVITENSTSVATKVSDNMVKMVDSLWKIDDASGEIANVLELKIILAAETNMKGIVTIEKSFEKIVKNLTELIEKGKAI